MIGIQPTSFLVQRLLTRKILKCGQRSFLYLWLSLMPFLATNLLSGEYAELRFVDAETGRGIPLVEARTVNDVLLVTDNFGRIAIAEPEWMDRDVYFSVRSHGYEIDRDGFGFSGVKVPLKPGSKHEFRLKRTNIAERIARLTGEGRFRDSVLLGYPVGDSHRQTPGGVVGQDSVQAIPFKNQLYWFWGDTQRIDYPLGLFRTAGARSSLHPLDDRRLSEGISFDYFVDPKGKFARSMIPYPSKPQGVVWITGLATVRDKTGIEKLVVHYSRREGLSKELEQGLAVWNDDKEIFEPVLVLSLEETWRKPSGHPVIYEEDGKRWLLFGSPHPNVRVEARLEQVLDPTAYEAFTCNKRDAKKNVLPEFNAAGIPMWRWQKELPPTDSKQERAWLNDRLITQEMCRFLPFDAQAPDRSVQLHSGTVQWNAYRNRWILIAGEYGGTSSLLGEVWYAEATSPLGPFKKGIKIATHDRMSFYNVCHHPFLDSSDGRFIYYEGTYTKDFSGSQEATPRYNYNQVLYRLDLGSNKLDRAR